jgi:hypothetical protein
VKTPITEIKVRVLDAETCDVIAIDGLLRTRHRVTVPSDHRLEELGLRDVDTASVVRETFFMVLEREPATSVPVVASLESIGNCYPGFWVELRGRLAAPPPEDLDTPCPGRSVRI